MRRFGFSLAALAASTALLGAGAASAAADFAIFKNNETAGTWSKISESNSTGSFVVQMASTNPAGGMKSSLYEPADHTASSYAAEWAPPTGTGTGTCFFSSNAHINAFGNMAFSQSVTNSTSQPHVCTGSVPATSNLDGSYDYNFEVG